MNFPNYKNQSIVNLMASVVKTLGGKSNYQPLKGLSLAGSANENIVLIVLDGLGYEFLRRYGKRSFLYKNLKGKMASVFPSTTATANTTFATGLAPQQHGLTGWFMYLKEIKKVTAILPLIPRGEERALKVSDKKAREIYNFRSAFEGLRTPLYAITHEDYINSAYNKSITKGFRRISYKSLPDFFGQIRKAVFKKSKRKYVYAYWGKLDSICHRKGVTSREARKHFRELDRRMRLLVEFLEDKNTTTIVTADHGQVDTREEDKIIKLEKYPEFVNFLELPLSGDPRVAFCYMKKSKTKQFEAYIRKNFSKICWLHKSSDLIKKQYFGFHKPNKKLSERIGDYVLIMKDNYIIKDFVQGEKRKIYVGNHGGVSAEEILVPLIVFRDDSFNRDILSPL